MKRPKPVPLTPAEREILTLQRNLWDAKTLAEINGCFDVAEKQIGVKADLPTRVGVLVQALAAFSVDEAPNRPIFKEGTWERICDLFIELMREAGEE